MTSSTLTDKPTSSRTVLTANVPGHCKARQNGCGGPTPFRVEYWNGDREFYCAQHLARAVRTAAREVHVRAFDPPLVLGDKRVTA